MQRIQCDNIKCDFQESGFVLEIYDPMLHFTYSLDIPQLAGKIIPGESKFQLKDEKLYLIMQKEVPT